MKKDDVRPLMVTIQCFTYNQEAYIRDCLEGFVMQKTNFRFEAIVHDDASTDGTAEVIREYEERYPDIIKPIYETENQYSKHDGSLQRIMDEYTHGKYIAYCEGDDYWIDPLKLQKQVDFLENNPDYAMSYTRSKHLEQKTGKLSLGPYSPFNGFENVLLKNPVETLTVVIRKESLSEYYKDINPSHYGWLMGDYPIWLYMSANYKIHYFSDVTSVYRMNQGSASRPTEFEKKMKFLQSHVDVQLFFAKKYNVSKDVVRAIDYKANYNMALACVGYKQYKKAIPFISNLKCKDACKCVAHVIMNIVR